MPPTVRAPERRHLRVLVRAAEAVILAAGAVAALAGPGWLGLAECSRAVSAIPGILFAMAAFALGIGRVRFPYGSAADQAALGIAAICAATATIATLNQALPCRLFQASTWIIPAIIVMLPKVAAALLRRPEPKPVVPRTPAVIHRSADLSRHPRTAVIVTLSRPVDEPRVRRQADAFYRAGWNVIAVGFKGTANKPQFWTLIELSLSPRPERVSTLAQVLRLRGLQRRLLGRLLLVLGRFSKECAERYYWLEGSYAQNVEDTLDAIVSTGLSCDLVANHDFYTLPIAARLAQSFAVPFTTDVHEYARGQYMHRRNFRIWYSHYVHSLQRRFFPRAALLTVVCKGIADLLAKEYRLQRPPLVVRNVSFYEPMPFRRAGERIRVLYHGILYEARGLEEAVRSLPLWRSEFELVIRGTGDASYVDSLRRLAQAHGVGSRLTFEPAVPLTELVRSANECDIGFFASADYSPQKRFTCPNKLFEYITAGLALCVSDLPEMRRVVAEHDLGRMFGSLAPQAIADTINGFTRESIDHHKKRSLEAAKVLCWEAERQPLIKAYEEMSTAQRC